MSLLVDLMHLLIVVAGVGAGTWALIALRHRRPRGRFVIFGFSTVCALFGCAALGGEVGLMPPTVWFAIVVSSLLAVALVGLGGGNRPRDTT